MARYDAWGRFDPGTRRGADTGPYGRGGRGPVPRGPRYGADYPMRGPGLEDEEIGRAVRWSLFEDTWLDARNIRIEVENGIVTLTGEVKDYLEARYAWDDAWETVGVRGVISRLEVRGTD